MEFMLQVTHKKQGKFISSPRLHSWDFELAHTLSLVLGCFSAADIPYNFALYA